MQKKCTKIWSFQKKAVLLHAFSLVCVKGINSGCKPAKRLQTEKRSIERSAIRVQSTKSRKVP